jgi:hypothetical protein
MVERERERHHRADGRRSVGRNDAVGNAPDGKDRRLRCVHDGEERIDTVHPEIRDGERAALDVGRGEPPGARGFDELRSPRGERGQVERVRPVNDGDDEGLVRRNGEADVDLVLRDDRAVAPRRVDARVLA